MRHDPRWQEAQHSERTYWDSLVYSDDAIRHVLSTNSMRAASLRRHVSIQAETALEIGAGPLGVGVIGFLPEIPRRHAVDPLRPVQMPASPGHSVELRAGIATRRAEIRYVVGCGEEIPFRSESMDLIICCNAIDHSSDPAAILREIYRVLAPNGTFYFDVDTFSTLGLVKWHLWTKRAHENEILVKGHPHRLREPDLISKLRGCGFVLQKLHGHTFASNLVGRARDSTFLGKKCLN
jgi:SAM-dependent methyltransferase